MVVAIKKKREGKRGEGKRRQQRKEKGKEKEKTDKDQILIPWSQITFGDVNRPGS